jgi:BirA family transcriptional regulator, biotin operon repressor / biotin---[acetyl-CoA-carboxylase] ligase
MSANPSQAASGSREPGPKPLCFALLRLLSDAEFHSGEKLAAQLGVSRASVNNALRSVADYGLTLYSVRGRGYRLLDPPQWLNESSIASHLGELAKKLHIDVVEVADSSNTLLMRQAARGAPGGSVLVVEWQAAGRGRLGRAWHSTLGNALTFSVLWRFEQGLSALSGLSLAVGVALIRALRTQGIKNVQLKWPNDVQDERGAKLAGILIEAQGDMLGPSFVVIGIGINLSLPVEVADRIEQPGAALNKMTAAMPERNLLLAELLRELVAVLQDFAAQGFASLRAEWEACHRAQDQPVRLLLPDGSDVSGVVRGVDNDGALRLEVTDPASGRPEIRIFHAGEISLRQG